MDDKLLVKVTYKFGRINTDTAKDTPKVLLFSLDVIQPAQEK